MDVAVLQPDRTHSRWVGPDDAVVVVGVRLGRYAHVGEIGYVGVSGALIRSERVRLHPLLRRCLHRDVERGDDLVAARIDGGAVAGVRALAAEQIRKLLADDQVELRGDHPRLGGGMEHDRFGLGLQYVRVAVLAPQQAVEVVDSHVLQDCVAALHDGLIGWHDEAAVVLLCGVRDQVVCRWRLEDGGQNRGLGNRQCAEIRDAEVALRGGGDPVALVAVEVEVQIGGDDRLLAGVAGEFLRQPDRLDDLLDLAIDGAGRRRQHVRHASNQLLRDSGCATRRAGQGIAQRRQDRGRIEAGVRPERLVFGAGGRVENDVRNLRKGKDAAILRPKGRQLVLPRPVVQHRLLVEVDILEEGLRILQVLAVRGIHPDGAREGDHAQGEEHAQDEEGQYGGDASTGRLSRSLPSRNATRTSDCDDAVRVGRDWSSWRLAR